MRSTAGSRFKEPFEIQGHNVFLGASIGISVYPNHSDQIEMIGTAINETGLDLDTLELEITESTMMRSPDLSGHILQRLRGLGVKVANERLGQEPKTGAQAEQGLRSAGIARIQGVAIGA